MNKVTSPPEPVEDNKLVFLSPKTIEWLMQKNSSAGGYENKFIKEWGFLRKANFTISDTPVTPKQAVAISLVIMAGYNRREASAIMGVTAQAVADHLAGGFKNIQRFLSGEKFKRPVLKRAQKKRKSK